MVRNEQWGSTLRWKHLEDLPNRRRPPVHRIVIAPDGTIYATTDAGIHNQQKDTWVPAFPFVNHPLWFIRDMAMDSHGEIWAATA